MTIANLGIAVQSAPAAAAAVDLDKLAASAKLAEAATDALGAESREAAVAIGQVSAAANVEAAANSKVTATTRMHTAALQAQASAMRMGNAQRTNLVFQLNDIGVSLASGMNPLLVAIQQGSQISTIYGPGEGGIGKALKETGNIAAGIATKFWPIALAVAAVTAGIAGMTSEIDKSTKVSVGFGDVFKAVGQTLWDTFSNFISPVTDELGDMFSAAWDVVIAVTKTTMNYLINSIVGAVKTIGAVWNGLPAALGEIGIVMANTIVTAFEGAINKAGDMLNAFIQMANQVLPGIAIGQIGKVELPKFANPLAGAKDRLGENIGAIANENVDYMGGFYNDVRAHAIDNAIARDKDAAKAAKEAAKEAERQAEAYRDLVRSAEERIAASELELNSIGMTAEATARLRNEQELLNKAANDNITLSEAQRSQLGGLAEAMAAAEAMAKRAKDAFEFTKDLTKGFLSDLRSEMQDGASFWEAFGEAGMNVLDKIISKIEDNLVDALFSMGGGGGAGGIFGFLGGLLGFAKGGVFSSGQQVQAFASGGVVNKPTMFPMANGAGLMGEAGPEAIMPLRRGPDGRLGVAAANQNGGGMIYVQATMQVVNGNLVPIITEVSGEVAGQKVAQAAPSIVGASVAQANKSAPGALARYQQQEQGGDYRNG